MNSKPRLNPLLEWLPHWFFAASFIFYLWLSWQRVPGILEDQGWFLQVSRRVAVGDLLYRDALWSYGPLPVYLMSALVRLGDFDIAFFSLLFTVNATIATLALYRLHRFVLSPISSVIGCVLVLFGWGAYLPFFFNYTPGIPIGATSMLITLLGLLGCLRNDNPRLGTLLIASGVAGALLSKQEYGFAAVILGVSVLGIVRFIQLAPTEPTPSVREMFIGFVLGGSVAVIAYGALALGAGWNALGEGMTGYQVLQATGGDAIGYFGRSAWVILAVAFVPTLAIVLGSLEYRLDLSPRKKWGLRASAIILLSGYLVFVLAWQSGWLSAVRSGQIGILDLASLLQRIDLTKRPLFSFLLVQLHKVLMLVIVVILLTLLPRWLDRLRNRAPVTFEQIAVLVAILFAMLIELRFLLFSTTLFQTIVLVFLIALLPSEYLWIKRLLEPGLHWGFVFICILFGMFALKTAYLTHWYVTSFNTPFASRYGTVLTDRVIHSIIVESIEYIEENSHPSDHIAIVGPYVGLYYLSERGHPFRQDYLSVFVGNAEHDALDYLARMHASPPVILLVPQGEQSYGILNLRGGPDKAGAVRATGRRLFGNAASQVEQYLEAHYQFDRFLNANGFLEFATFKRKE